MTIQKIIDKLFCMHDWEQWRTIDASDYLGNRWIVYHFCCKKCGKFKKIKSM